MFRISVNSERDIIVTDNGSFRNYFLPSTSNKHEPNKTVWTPKPHFVVQDGDFKKPLPVKNQINFRFNGLINCIGDLMPCTHKLAIQLNDFFAVVLTDEANIVEKT